MKKYAAGHAGNSFGVHVADWETIEFDDGRIIDAQTGVELVPPMSVEQRLIAAIKALPDHQVFPGRNGGSVMIAITRANGVSQQSVWLGRSSSIERLERILSDSFLGKTIVHMGEVWRVIGVGAQRDGNTFCHLLNLYRGRKQKNGFVPAQINDWVDTAVLQAARKA